MEGMEVWFPNRRLAFDKKHGPPGRHRPDDPMPSLDKESTRTFERITGFWFFSQVGGGFEPRLFPTGASKRFPELAG
jgi:hypothetical protein